MKRTMNLAALAIILGCGTTIAQQSNIKIGALAMAPPDVSIEKQHDYLVA